MAIITVQLADSITAADVLLLCERLQVQLARSDVAALACDTGRLTDPDVTMVDVLARLQLTSPSRGLLDERVPCIKRVARTAAVGGVGRPRANRNAITVRTLDGRPNKANRPGSTKWVSRWIRPADTSMV